MKGAHEVIARSLRCRIGRVRIVGRSFHEEIIAIRCFSFGLSECAIHLIGRDVIEAFTLVAFGQTFPIVARSLQERERAHHVGACKAEGIFDRSVHVTLCSKVDNASDLVTFQERTHGGEIANIGFLKHIVGSLLHILEIGEVASVG